MIRSHFRMRHDADGFEAAHFTRHLEGRVERGERLHVRAGAHMFVTVKNGDAVLILDRNDGILEVAVLPGVRGTLLAFHRIGIHVVTREAVFRGNQIGRDTLRHENRPGS